MGGQQMPTEWTGDPIREVYRKDIDARPVIHLGVDMRLDLSAHRLRTHELGWLSCGARTRDGDGTRDRQEPRGSFWRQPQRLGA